MFNRQRAQLIRSVEEAGTLLMGNSHIKERIAKSSRFDYGIPQDLQSEEIILNTVRELQLDCQIITEESGVHGSRTAEYQIYIDPLDGTVNYSHGVPSFCVGVAVYQRSKPLFGVIYDPSLQQLFVAERDKGVHINGKPIHAQTIDSDVDLQINLEWFGANDFPRISDQLRQAGIRARTAGSGILALLYGAIGRGDGTILLQNKPWDVAPGLVFAAELGCICTTPQGLPVSLDMPHIDVVAGQPAVHQRLIQAIQTERS